MGDADLLALPSSAEDSTSCVQAQLHAQHAKDWKPIVLKNARIEEPKEKPRNSWESICPKRIETPFETAPPPSPHPSTSSRSRQSESDTQEGARPSSSSSESTPASKPPPSPIRSLKPTRLWIEDGPTAGKAISAWKEKNVQTLHTWTKDMTIETRTQKFDALIAQDQDTHLQSVAMYYTFHPEHLPTRELSQRRKAALETGMKDLTPYQQRQQREIFRRWLVAPSPEGTGGEWTWNSDPPKSRIEDRVGPKNEITPDAMPPECKHCLYVPRREKFREMVLASVGATVRWRKPRASKVEPHQQSTSPPPAPPPAAAAKEAKRTSGGMYDSAISDCGSSGKLESGDVSCEDLGGTSMTSGDSSRPRDLTETGVGMRKPRVLPRRMRMRSSGIFRNSTVQ